MSDIKTKTNRNKLAKRHEPYWERRRPGGAVGFRKTRTHEETPEAAAGVWVARWRVDTGQIYNTLGDLREFPPEKRYQEAEALADAWFDAQGVASGRHTVQEAADAYLESLQADGRESAYRDARMRIKARIAPKLGKYYLDELKPKQLTKWRNSFIPTIDDVGELDPDEAVEVGRKARDTMNRYIATLKAILNYAHDQDLIGTNRAWSKTKLKKFEKTRRARDVFLDDDQIGRLLEHGGQDFTNLCRGLLLTGLRPGIEIEALLVEQLTQDGRLDVQQSKTDPRIVELSSEAFDFMKSMTRSKTPKARIFTTEGRPWREKEAGRIMREVRTAAKLPAETVLYSLRHTYISRALQHGASIKLVAANCGTSIQMIESHYWKFIRGHRQAMLDAIPSLPGGRASD